MNAPGRRKCGVVGVRTFLVVNDVMTISARFQLVAILKYEVRTLMRRITSIFAKLSTFSADSLFTK